MSRPRRSAVHKYHDRVAARYDHSYDDAFWQWHDALTWDYLKPFLPKDLSAPVVDLGCGTGKWMAKVARSGYRVTGVDISGKMLDQSARKMDESGVAGRGTFVQADLCSMAEIPAKSFGMALAMGDPIGCASNPRSALKEIRRILTADGVLVATFDNRLSAVDFYLARGDIREFERFLRDGKTHWLTRDEDEQFPLHTYAPAELRRLIEGAGFVIRDMVGKTVLPMRHHRKLLEDSAARRQWAKIEKSLCRDPAAIGRASHIQVACTIPK